MLTYQYDDDGRRTQVAATIDGTADFVDEYVYDSLGRVVLVSEHGVAGGNLVAPKEIRLSYNDAGQLVSIDRYQDGQLAVEGDYSYDSVGRLVGLVYHQGDTVLNSYAWTYDGSGYSLIQYLQSPSPSTWSPTGGLMPVHDTAGVIAILTSGGLTRFALVTSCTSVDGTASYSYDPTGQLIGASYTGGVLPDESYTWDANGNPAGTGYVIGAGNRLLSDGVYRYSYNAEGNRTARWTDVNQDGLLDSGDTNITQYTWDTRNRLVKVTDRATFGGMPTQVVDFLYDAENRWIGESIDEDGDGVIDHQTRFIYDGNQIVLQFDKDGAEDVTGQDLSHRYLWQPDAVDQVLADERTHLDGGGIVTDEVLWPLADNLGTVRDVAKLDAATGATAVVDHVIYDSFGKVVSESDPAAGSLFGFTGRPTSKATGLRNHLNRWNDPQTADWLSEDPSGLTAGDTNTRRYCGNSPVNATDPSGLDRLQTKLIPKPRTAWQDFLGVPHEYERERLVNWYTSKGGFEIGKATMTSTVGGEPDVNDIQWITLYPELGGQRISGSELRLAMEWANWFGGTDGDIVKVKECLKLAQSKAETPWARLGKLADGRYAKLVTLLDSESWSVWYGPAPSTGTYLTTPGAPVSKPGVQKQFNEVINRPGQVASEDFWFAFFTAFNGVGAPYSTAAQAASPGGHGMGENTSRPDVLDEQKYLFPGARDRNLHLMGKSHQETLLAKPAWLGAVKNDSASSAALVAQSFANALGEALDGLSSVEIYAESMVVDGEKRLYVTVVDKNGIMPYRSMMGLTGSKNVIGASAILARWIGYAKPLNVVPGWLDSRGGSRK